MLVNYKIYLLIAGAMAGTFFIVVLMIFLQVKTQNRILQQKKLMAENEMQHQKDLARIFIISQEQERKRIGMDLHDEVGTALSSLRMLLEKMNDMCNAVHFSTLHTNGKESIDRIINNVRRISHNLSPFTKGGYELREAVEDMTEQINMSNELSASVSFGDVKDVMFLNDEVQLALYRMLCELVNNTVKHAMASTINISFEQKAHVLTVVYTDNGIGLRNTNSDKSGIGMANIESRCNMINATYEIDRNVEKGFGITIAIPLHDDKCSHS